MKSIVLTAVFEEVPALEGGGYTAYVEELPGAISEGETLEETRENLRDAIKTIMDADPTVGRTGFSPKKTIREKITISAA